MNRLLLTLVASATLLALGSPSPGDAQPQDNSAGYDGGGSGEIPQGARAACAPEALCGTVGPLVNTHWIADGEWEPTLDLLGFVTVDATSSSIVFMDPNTCTTFFTCNPSVFTTSYRAFTWGINGGDMWVSGWNEPVLLYHLDVGCNQIAVFNIAGLQIAGLAMDYANGHLWAMQRSPVGGPNSNLLEFDITSGIPELIQGPIPVSWGGAGPGIGSAGLEYDKTTCSIVALRQDSNNVGVSFIEVFADLDPSGPGGVAYLANCDITTSQFCTGPGTFVNHPWGLALKENAAPDRKVIITDIDLVAGCGIPGPGAGPIDFHYYPLPAAPPACAATSVETATWGQIKALHGGP